MGMDIWKNSLSKAYPKRQSRFTLFTLSQANRRTSSFYRSLSRASVSDFKGMMVKELERLCDRDYWLTAEEAKSADVVDRVI